MESDECREAYRKVFEQRMYQGRLDSLLEQDECSSLQDAYLASLPRDKCARAHRYRSVGTGFPAFVTCGCGGELWGRDGPLELNFAAVLGHTLLHFGAEAACAVCIKTGIVCLFRAWLLSDTSDRGLIGVACAAACECVSRSYLLSEAGNALVREISLDCPGRCRQQATAWCQGMGAEDTSLDLLADVTGELRGSFRNDLTSLCNTPGVYLPPGYATLDPYTKGIASLYYFAVSFGPGEDSGLIAPIISWCMVSELASQFSQSNVNQNTESAHLCFAPLAGPALNSVLATRAQANRPVRRSVFPTLDAYIRERMADGFWYAAYAAADAAAADSWYLSRESVPTHKYATDSVCAFDTFSHSRALIEDALYDATDYRRETETGVPPPSPDAYQEVLFSSGYIALASQVWGAPVHLDLMQRQAVHRTLTTHWYAGVWHDALFASTLPGALYRETVRTKELGRFTGDQVFTGCGEECPCPLRYHKYGLGATLSWTRQAWCGQSDPVAPSESRAFGNFVDGVRTILRCGEGRHDPLSRMDNPGALPTRKACIGKLAQVRCQIIHLLVWCALDSQSDKPRTTVLH
ncbi:uncharacterized protein PGRI_068550 [Penicillium griseofulvum]|uniref:Uncharacterized protein n=1 Tax=Penicillium patulum TaxID=5078 RepID=A0A135LN29_PENPA|nr:uncharacterized protein PGRI_068550 [Penicillium griseofulvum]KXG50364.1 hypothetical protein PGRI_068550 [Penicillium griseofulvum]